MTEQPSQPSLLSGTVAFLFTDIENSMVGWEQQPHAMAEAVARHDAILRTVIAEHGGHVFKTIGDAFCAVFPSVAPALATAVAAQRGLVAETWGEVGAVHVRMAIHLGEAHERDADYFGPALNRVARLLAAGHGGQILVSATAADIVRDQLPPMEQLRDLGAHLLKGLTLPERIFQLVVEDLRSEFPPIVTLDNRPNNLPPQLTSLVGREQEVAAVRELLERDDVRLVTLTGPGGVGKTRLSLQVAAEMLDTYTDGVFFVLLEQTTDSALELPVIAQTLGLRESPGKALAETLREYLTSKQLLLDLDNVEQIVGAGPPLVETLRAAPAVKILVSSRVRLGVQGEREYAISSLGLPPRRGVRTARELGQYPAVRLFVERAQAVRGDFALTDANAVAVADICRALDGLPLAIELAAAWVRVMPPRAMLPQLEHRLNLLTGGGGDRPARQQTLRGAIAWSYDLLQPAQRTLLARLSVFAGGCTYEAAAAVANADGSLDLFQSLTALVDQNLVWQQAGDDGEARFGMLATIREFAREQLEAVGGGEDVLIQMLHAEYVLALAERAEPELTGADQVAWLERLEADNDNLRAALGWLHESNEAELGLRLSGALRRFWYIRGYSSEGRDWLERGLERWEEASLPVVAKALDAAGALALSQGDYRQAMGLFEQALELYADAGNTAGEARARVQLGSVALEQGRYDDAEQHFEDGLTLYRASGDTRGVSVQLNNIGALAFLRQDFDRAATSYSEGLAISRKSGDHQTAAIALENLAEAREHQGDRIVAIALYEEALVLFRRLGDKLNTAFTLTGLGRATWGIGDAPRAARLFAESLALCHEIGDFVGIAAALEGIGVLAEEQADAARAVRILAAADALRGEIDAPLADAYRLAHDQHITRLREGLGEVAWAAAWADGQALPVDQAVAEAERITAEIRSPVDAATERASPLG